MPLEGAPDQSSYYPSAKVKITIRFDEFKDGESLTDQAPRIPAKNLNGVKNERSPLIAVKEDDGGQVRYRLTTRPQELKTKGVKATDQRRSLDGFTFDIAGIIPKEAQWKQNNVRTADTLSLTIKWTDMPIDPRVLRAAAVEFYLGTVSPEDYAAGIAGQSRPGDQASGTLAEPLHVIPDSSPDPASPSGTRSNLRFTGFVDKYSMTWSDGEPVVKLECVDNTRLLLDEEAPPNLNLSAAQQDMTIVESVAQYLSHFPQFEDMTVTYLPAGETPPSLNSALAGTAYRPELGPPPSKGGGGDEKTTVLDYLTDVCGAVAHLVRVVGQEVVIQKPTTMFNNNPTPRSDDPYRTRKLGSGDYPIRAFIFGQNILELEVEKHFTANKVKCVEFRCYSPARKKDLVARSPKENKDRPTDANPGAGKTDQKWKVIKVAGVNDQQVLQDLADGYYNMRGRNEISFKIKTKNIASFGGGNADPDLLDLKIGDAIDIMVDKDGDGTQGQITKELSAIDLNREFMKNLGYPEALAAAYATAYVEAQLLKSYIVKEVDCQWGVDEGVSFNITAINFVAIRVDKPDATAPPAPPPAPSGQPKKNFPSVPFRF